MNLLGGQNIHNILNQSQLNLPLNRSRDSKSPLHGFRERRYRLGGQKVIFKRNVSVTQVPVEETNAVASKLGNVYSSNNNSYFDINQVNSFQHTSAVQQIISNLNLDKKNDDPNSSQGSFRLNVTYDIITPEEMAETQKLMLSNNPSPHKGTSAEKKNQRLLLKMQKKNKSDAGEKNSEIVKL